MDKKIYFSKVQFTHTTHGRELDRLLLDLDAKELSFQTFEYVKNMPSIIGYGYYDVFGELILNDFTNPGIFVKSCKNNFSKQIIPIEKEEKIVTFSYGIKLSMNLIFDNEHSWPTEKLYNYLKNTYIIKD